MIPSSQPVKAEKTAEEKRPAKNTAEMNRKQAMQAVARYNKQLNQERKEERACSLDLQTYTINYPVGMGINHRMYEKYYRRHGEWTPKRRIGNFPVALLPEQYQDHYDQYSASKLTQLPLSKAKIYTGYDPEKIPQNLPAMQVDEYYDLSESDDDIENCDCHIDEVVKKPDVHESVNNDDVFLAALKVKLKSCPTPNNITTELSSSSANNHSTPSTPNKPGIIASLSASLTNSVPLNIQSGLGPLDDNDCKICKTSMTTGSLLKCSKCGIASHATCLDITGELLDAIRLYPWQCTDCKVCTQCQQPHDEDKMMFCDKCDRGYHTYCVGLSSIPDGHWVCSLCAKCTTCGTKTLQKVGDLLTEWQHEVISLHSPDGQKLVRHQVYCFTCYQQRNK